TGIVDFYHFGGDADAVPPASVPALKLWVRFTNLSDDQIIAPIDRTLLFKRAYDEEADEFIANNFVTPAAASDGSLSLSILDLPLTSVWNLKDQQLGVRLDPGQSVDVYLPAEPIDLDAIEGEWIWRMHIRKGYHASTGHGVTTLVEVVWNRDDVQPEPSLGHDAG
ncbi:MAG: hypothetical protein KF861_12665, partial [Planctomycetaceae bacterium]|nr:hypothetical protein [Planctomycetaceae bacterium]